MVNMDARAAADLARLRSKDRALLRPEMPRRPRSYHELGRSEEAEVEAVAFKRRPHSIYADAPPVPPVGRGRDSSPQPVGLAPNPLPGSSIRARSTGRGPVVSQLINRYDTYGQRIPQAEQPDWDAHARVWSQRRKSIGEGLHQKTEASQVRSLTKAQRTTSLPPEEMMLYDRYSGGLNYGYEGRGHGIGGSAGMRQLHSAASRKSMQFSNQFGVDLSDVPVFLQKM
jgi:hypothetical protein